MLLLLSASLDSSSARVRGPVVRVVPAGGVGEGVLQPDGGRFGLLLRRHGEGGEGVGVLEEVACGRHGGGGGVGVGGVGGGGGVVEVRRCEGGVGGAFGGGCGRRRVVGGLARVGGEFLHDVHGLRVAVDDGVGGVGGEARVDGWLGGGALAVGEVRVVSEMG